MTDISYRKQEFRKLAFSQRKQAHNTYSGNAATKNLVNYLAPYMNENVSAYMPIRSEINCLPAMAMIAMRTTVCIPVVVENGQPLEFQRWSPTANLKEGPFNVKVPLVADVVIPNVVILPLLAFDALGYRLGYGGGFYDRTLDKLRAIGPVVAVGFAYEAQRISSVPVEKTDQVMDAVVTERGITVF